MRQMRAKNTRKFDLCKKKLQIFGPCEKYATREKYAKKFSLAKNAKNLRISIFAEFAQIFALRKKIRNCTKCPKIREYLLSTKGYAIFVKNTLC
jgi:hypothetical protein